MPRPTSHRAKAAAIAMLMVLSACDPIRQVSGKVRSVPSAPGEPRLAASATPLSGVILRLTCGEIPAAFPDPLAGSYVIAISGPEGTFDYVDIGYWAPDCVVEFQSGDGSHESRRFPISDLCRQYTGDDDCLQIKGMTVDLVRRGASPPPVELSVRTTPANLELRTDEAAKCRTPCKVQVSPGLHRFELFVSERRGRQEVAFWFLVPMTVGAFMMPVGLVKKDATLIGAGAGIAVGAGVGFALVWKSDDVEVSVKPASDR